MIPSLIVPAGIYILTVTWLMGTKTLEIAYWQSFLKELVDDNGSLLFPAKYLTAKAPSSQNICTSDRIQMGYKIPSNLHSPYFFSRNFLQIIRYN